MWPRAARSVDNATAAAICQRAKELGATPVGVFVDETPDVIEQRAQQAGLQLVQLHGDGARAGLNGLPSSLGIVYVMHASPDGAIHTALPSEMPCTDAQSRRRVRCFSTPCRSCLVSEA